MGIDELHGTQGWNISPGRNKEQEENCCLEAYQHSLVIDCRARDEIGSWTWNDCDFLVFQTGAIYTSKN